MEEEEEDGEVEEEKPVCFKITGDLVLLLMSLAYLDPFYHILHVVHLNSA